MFFFSLLYIFECLFRAHSSKRKFRIPDLCIRKGLSHDYLQRLNDNILLYI